MNKNRKHKDKTMKYLDILKKFDQAIVTESRNLQDIYDNIVKDGHASNQVCNEDETEVTGNGENEDRTDRNDGGENCTCQKESEDDKKRACEFASEREEDNAAPDGQEGQPAGNDKKMLSAQDFFREMDDQKTLDETTQDSNDGEERSVSEDSTSKEVEEFFDDGEDNKSGDKETASSKPSDNENSENGGANESSVDRAALNASELFEDGDVDSADASTEGAGNEGSETTDETPDNADKKQTDGKTVEKTDESSKCNKEKTAEDWLNEGDDEATGQDKSKDDFQDKKCEKCGNYPCTCDNGTTDDEGDDEDEDLEVESLQESIKNISAFVQANKKLFVG